MILRVFASRALAVATLALSIMLLACRGGASDATPTSGARPAATATTAASTAAPSPADTRPVVEDGYRGEEVFPHISFPEMLGLEAIPGDERYALVLSKDGLIRRADLTDDASEPAVFMDISDKLIKNPGQEEGLLGLAFAPDYATSGKFYVYYSAGNPRRAVISRFVARGESADSDTEQVLLEIGEPYANHNGGALVFGPDGYLYIGVGDGGSAGDPQGNGQNTQTLLGKILRIDVSGNDYTAPADNPFAHDGGRGEIWAYGLRNPWRLAFDHETGKLWTADVGQGKWEEVDVIEKGGNYGWNITEGAHCYKPSSGCDMTGLLAPRAEYNHGEGCSITGGFVYRGSAMPELRGWYVYSDYCSGRVWAVNGADASSEPVRLGDTKASVTSFGEDASGELYLVTFDKEILRLRRL